MEKHVNLRIEGSFESEQEPIITNVKANYYKKNDNHYLQFDEEIECEVIKNLYRLHPNRVQISKKGSIDTKMEFIKDEHSYTNYKTPFGVFVMEIETQKIEIVETKTLITAKIKYTMSLQHGAKEAHTILIQITQREGIWEEL